MRSATSYLALLTGFAALAISSFAGTSTASDFENPKLSNAFYQCVKGAGRSTVGLGICMHAEFQRQDGGLNQVYQRVMGHLSASQRATLRDNERRWVRMTKSHCDHAGDEIKGGTGQPILIEQCFMFETAKRVDVLANNKF